MKYEHQINYAYVYTNNLDDWNSRLVGNAWIVLLFTLTLHPPEWMSNSKGCTSYDCKNRTSSYDFLRIIQVDALLLSVSFKPISVDFTLIIDMLALSAIHGHHRRVCFYNFLNTMNFFIVFAKHYEFFKSVSKHYEFFHSV